MSYIKFRNGGHKEFAARILSHEFDIELDRIKINQDVYDVSEENMDRLKYCGVEFDSIK